MASIPAKNGETRNIATRWSKSTRSRRRPNTGTNIRLRQGALPQRSTRSAPIWTRTFFLSWVTNRHSTSRMRTAPSCRNASKDAMRTTSRKKPGAGSNKSSARPSRGDYAKTILRRSFAQLQQRGRRSSTTLTCSNRLWCKWLVWPRCFL
jgi:hypothetical protein